MQVSRYLKNFIIWKISFALRVAKYVIFIHKQVPVTQKRNEEKPKDIKIFPITLRYYFFILFSCYYDSSEIFPCKSTSRCVRVMLETWDLMRGSFESYILQYHVLGSYWCNFFLKKLCNLKAKTKMICLNLLYDFFFSKL